jgi:hypothetical protein
MKIAKKTKNPSGSVAKPARPSTPVATAGKARAVLVGLTHIDPAWHGGWNGRNGCAGCALDVVGLETVLSPRGWAIERLLDNEATVGAVLDKLAGVAAQSKAGDSIFFYYSGHGGQQPDKNGDESDGQDETLICYDGHLVDDRLNDIWLSCASGVRIYMISDSCNSETNFRLAPGNTDGTFPKVQLRAISTAQGVDKGEKKLKAKLLHLGGCRDGRTSLGASDGGVFTKAIVKDIQSGFKGTWAELHKRAADDVSESQDATISLYPKEGNVLDKETAFEPAPGGGDGEVAPASGDVGSRKKRTRGPEPELAAIPVTTVVSAATDGDRMLAKIDRAFALRAADARSAEAVGTRGESIRLVAEGDSWFDFKIRPDVIDWLERDYGYDIENSGRGGACIYEMAYGPDDDTTFGIFGRDASQLEQVVRNIREHKPAAFLLSAGGNDFVGPEFIMAIHHALAKKSGINWGVIQGLFKDDVEPGFRLIIETALAAARGAGLGEIPVILHGYDYAFPDGRSAVNVIVKKIGPWMGPSFDMKGYPYRNDQDLAERRKIVSPMIDTIYLMLARLKESYRSIRIVDVRGTLTSRSDWHDELHPTGEGFKRVAALFHQVIQIALGRGDGNRGPVQPPGPPPIR